MLARFPLLAFAAFAAFASAFSKKHSSTCDNLQVINEGQPAGELKSINGIQIYHAYPQKKQRIYDSAILFVSDIYGVPLLENKLLADSLARANHLVIFPDLFKGDAINASDPEASLNLGPWLAKHPAPDIDSVIASTITYMKTNLGVKKIAGVGYCFGGKYVPRFMARGKGIEAGFIAHPSFLEADEIRGIAGPISIAAGELDPVFNVTLRRNAEDILQQMNATYQTTLYAGAPHGFAVRVDMNNPRQVYAKESSYLQAVRWFDAWF
ncbi:dienelactone hydrolase family protein [Delitschia confertaspora ATCC 74209]|uniref:Dienelactone hydrolase family protein n=1 Tax=Delitschia confertaspora ATCC 74209 TaxID=1513339 RepID=A0A9P4JPI3_9PLEO|nr:dienelactone hydrolase family protein [Delitschia confertaspora ATCC 74209]